MEKEGINRPFENLAIMIGRRPAAATKKINTYKERPPVKIKEFSSEDENIFLTAMEDVIPIKKNNVADLPQRNSASETFSHSKRDNLSSCEDPEKIIEALNRLVENGEGFEVSSTSEYVEGTGLGVHRSIIERLHKRDFAIQAHIDLHGKNVDEAMADMDEFIKSSLVLGKNGLLIIHGRGLSSPDEPVLKTKVIERLTRGKWRRWVIAFCSAPLCDGGGGGTYVLFRDRPLPRKHFKRNKIKW